VSEIVKLYKDRDWLEQKYLVEKLSATEISKLFGCSHKTITKSLKKYNISLRNKALTLSIKYKKDADVNDHKGYSKYKNYEYLYQRYIIEQKTAKEISDDLGYEQSTVVKWLRLFNIPRRNDSDQRNLLYKNSEQSKNINHDYYTEYANNLISITPTIAMEIGFLFGDGSIRKNHIRLGLDKKDIEILDYFNTKWFYTPIKYYNRPNTNMNCIYFYSHQMQKDLNILGILDAKTYKDYIIDWLFGVDVSIREAFLYGLILADGTVNPKQRLVSIVNHISSEPFLTKLIHSIYTPYEVHIHYSNNNKAVRYNLNRDATLKLANNIKLLVETNIMPKLLDRKYNRLISKIDGAKSYV
jgi:hypothetical protein